MLAEAEVRSARGAVARIRNLLPALVPSERSVGDYALTSPELVARMSVNQLAKAAEVSATTVMRFCKRLGFDGFSDFRFALARELGEAAQHDDDAVGPEDDVATVADKVFRADVRALQETLQLLDKDELGKAVAALENASHIHIFGTGSSAPVVLDAYYRFSCLGLPVSFVVDTFMQTVSATGLGAGDVALVVSHTGRTEKSLAIAERATKLGAVVIGLTSFLGSPLTELAEVALVTAAGETTFREGTMASRLAQLSVVDALYVAMANRKGDASQQLDFINLLLEEQRVST